MQTQIFMVHKRHLGLRAPTVLAVGFALTILVGALVLMLPVSAADGQITPFLDALFTAASARAVLPDSSRSARRCTGRYSASASSCC